MRIITHRCTLCGTVVAANELEDRRSMKCPAQSCDAVLEFSDLPRDDQEFFLDRREQYRMDS